MRNLKIRMDAIKGSNYGRNTASGQEKFENTYSG